MASSGFATVHPNNRLTINVVEAASLEKFSLEVGVDVTSFSLIDDSVLQAVRTNLAEALKVASGSGSEVDKAEARVEADVYEALQHALAK
ncbi:hypothetical protein C0992_000740 [Termitomyces sp. T32_za158]|nr:hypothetical protein C0992_000740 [Termitomyces sp. T32_za158]